MPWESDFFPEPVWNFMTNLGLLVAIVAALSAIRWLWKHGPALLVKYGWDWMTRLGNRWETQRDKTT